MKWIDCKDGLPEVGVDVLIAKVSSSTGKWAMWVDRRYKYEGAIQGIFFGAFPAGNARGIQPTHWQHLPTPPCDEAQND